MGIDEVLVVGLERDGGAGKGGTCPGDVASDEASERERASGAEVDGGVEGGAAAAAGAGGVDGRAGAGAGAAAATGEAGAGAGAGCSAWDDSRRRRYVGVVSAGVELACEKRAGGREARGEEGSATMSMRGRRVFHMLAARPASCTHPSPARQQPRSRALGDIKRGSERRRRGRTRPADACRASRPSRPSRSPPSSWPGPRRRSLAAPSSPPGSWPTLTPTSPRRGS